MVFATSTKKLNSQILFIDIALYKKYLYVQLEQSLNNY